MNSTSPGGRGHLDQQMQKLLAAADGDGEDEEESSQAIAIASTNNGKMNDEISL